VVILGTHLDLDRSTLACVRGEAIFFSSLGVPNMHASQLLSITAASLNRTSYLTLFASRSGVALIAQNILRNQLLVFV